MRFLSAILIASVLIVPATSMATPAVPQSKNYAIQISGHLSEYTYLAAAQDAMMEGLHHLNAMGDLAMNVLDMGQVTPSDEQQFEEHAIAYRNLRNATFNNVPWFSDSTVILNGDTTHPISLVFPELKSMHLSFYSQDEAQQIVNTMNDDIAIINQWLPTQDEIAAYKNNHLSADNTTMLSDEYTYTLKSNSPEFLNQLREMQSAMRDTLINMRHYAMLGAKAKNEASFNKARDDFFESRYAFWDMVLKKFDKVHIFFEPDTKISLYFQHQFHTVNLPNLSSLDIYTLTDDFPRAMTDYMHILATEEKIRIWLATGTMPADDDQNIKNYVANKVAAMNQRKALKKP